MIRTCLDLRPLVAVRPRAQAPVGMWPRAGIVLPLLPRGSAFGFLAAPPRPAPRAPRLTAGVHARAAAKEAVPAPTDPRWRGLAQRLTQLARTLTQDPRLQIAPAERWHYNLATHVLEVPSEALLAGDEAFVLGATCRWVGRRLYSRRVDAPEMSQAAFALLWAAVEDARTGRMLGARLAGVPALLGQFYRGFLAAAEGSNRAGQAIAALLREGALGQRTRHPADPALDALLAQARPLLERATALPAELDWSADDLTDAEADAACAAAFAVVRDELWPLLADLLKELDVDELAGDEVGEEGGEGEAGQGEGKAGKKGEKAGEAGDGEAAEESEGGEGEPAQGSAEGKAKKASKAGGKLTRKTGQELREMLDAGQEIEAADGAELTPSEAEMLARKGTVGHAGDDEVSLDEQMEALEESVRRDVGAKTNDSPYEKLRAEHAQSIEDMVAHLGNALAREEAPQYTGHSKRGRLHMGRFIQSQLREEHTGVSDPNVFQRREEPHERSVAVVSCMDISGSMAGDNIQAARAAFVVLQEALNQLGIPSGSIAFNHTPVLLQPLGYHDEASRHSALHSLQASGGNNEPAALKLAAEALKDSDAAHKVVLFLTDGGAVDDCKAYVEKTERETGVKVIGIGIGAGCGEVPHIYVNHVVVPVISDPASEDGRCAARGFGAGGVKPKTEEARNSAVEGVLVRVQNGPEA